MLGLSTGQWGERGRGGGVSEREREMEKGAWSVHHGLGTGRIQLEVKLVHIVPDFFEMELDVENCCRKSVVLNVSWYFHLNWSVQCLFCTHFQTKTTIKEKIFFPHFKHIMRKRSSKTVLSLMTAMSAGFIVFFFLNIWNSFCTSVLFPCPCSWSESRRTLYTLSISTLCL